MRREEFLKKLAYLLQDIPDDERDEAMSYYRDYLEEAGPENEEKAMEEFGSPERVAAIIRADVTGNLRDGGSFTEKGYEDERFRDPNYQVAKRLDLPDEREMPKKEKHSEKAYGEPEKKRWAGSVWKWILLGVLLIMASPLLLGTGGILLGVLAAVVGAVVCVIALTAAAFIVSVVVAVWGIGFVITTPLDSLFLLGMALVGIGCGLLGVAIMVVVFGVILPFCVKEIWKGIQTLMGKGKEAA